MSDRFDVVTFKETQNGKTFAVRLGSAVKSKKGDGWNLYLDAMPAPVDGQFRLSVVPPRERQDDGNSRKPAPAGDDGDGIPF
jgi:hypothetical protein